MGLEEIANLDREQAIEALNLRTRRYAAVPAKVDASYSGPCSVAATALRVKSPMRSSKWSAQGNVYLLVENEPVTVTSRGSCQQSTRRTASSKS